MNQPTPHTATHEIVVDEVFPHAPERLWAALTDGALMARWMMPPAGFAPVVGTRFTFQTTPRGGWDGTIQCEVLEVVPNRRLVYSWKGGHAGNVGYGAPLSTLVTWTVAPAPGGTRLLLVHSGFVLPDNQTAFENMGSGWKTVLGRLKGAIGDVH